MKHANVKTKLDGAKGTQGALISEECVQTDRRVVSGCTDAVWFLPGHPSFEVDPLHPGSAAVVDVGTPEAHGARLA